MGKKADIYLQADISSLGMTHNHDNLLNIWNILLNL